MSILYLNDSFFSLFGFSKCAKESMKCLLLSQELLCNIIYNDSFQTSLT